MIHLEDCNEHAPRARRDGASGTGTTTARRHLRGILALAAVMAGVLGAGTASAQTVQAHVVYLAVPSGASKSGEVTFDLPRAIRVGGQWYIMPNPGLAGTHTCTIDATLTGQSGHMDLYARINRGRVSSAFRARLTRDAGLSLLIGGCDADPATNDVFQGDATSLYAEVAVWLAQALGSTEYTGSADTVEDEIREFFGIGVQNTRKVAKLLDFEGILLQNRGGSATGVGNAHLTLAFLP